MRIAVSDNGFDILFKFYYYIIYFTFKQML